MSDGDLRNLDRLLSQSPGDPELRKRWIVQKARVGEAVIKTDYKVKRDGKYLSTGDYRV